MSKTNVPGACSRREFLRAVGWSSCAAAGASLLTARRTEAIFDDPRYGVRECMFYDKLEDQKIKCVICPKECVVADHERGYCGNKENRDGVYYTLVFGKACSSPYAADPIEKKPLFHYLPGTRAYSIAAAGCNMECKFCQNWETAQYRPEQVTSDERTPDTVVAMAKQAACPTIAYTYTEPTVFYEYMIETAKVGRQQGIGSVMISNGYMKAEPLKELCKHLTAVKIDFKAFTEKFYKETCSGELKPVLETLVLLKQLGMWFEMVVLIVPTLNDSPDEFRGMCSWIKQNLGPDVPIHFTRFHPMYKITNLPPTPASTLETAHRIAKEAGLNYTYLGNVPGHKLESTFCPKCDNVVIHRTGYAIRAINMEKGNCSKCGNPIPGVWENPA